MRGYKKEKIDYKELTYYQNDDYENNDILNSLFYAEEALVGNVVVAYSDILFESAVVKRLLESDADISIVVDIDWQGDYVDRKDHPVAEAGKVIFNANNEVLKIGKVLTEKMMFMVDSSACCNFLLAVPKFSKNIFIDQKNYIGINHSNEQKHSRKPI